MINLDDAPPPPPAVANCPDDTEIGRHYYKGFPVWIYAAKRNGTTEEWRPGKIETAGLNTVLVNVPEDHVTIATNRYQVRPRTNDTPPTGAPRCVIVGQPERSPADTRRTPTGMQRGD